jgi:ferredoxin
MSDLLTGVRTALHSYREYGGGKAAVLFYDAGTGARAFRAVAASMPEWVLPFEIEEPGSIGMDAWLATLAYGARQVLLLVTGSAAPSVLRELSLQLSYASALLEGLGFAGRRIQLLCDGERAATALTRALEGLDDTAEIPPAGFAAFDEKRTTLGLALDHLYAHAPVPQPVAVLPEGAPFGEIRVDATACTLCMACVSVCPSKALHDGGDRPALRFVEGNCVQCGLCHNACPEDAITLAPRVVYERAARGEMRVLHEEAAFRCVVCGKPFATQKIIDRMMEKLSGHWMFQDEAARRRLQMCEDCRVMDMFEQGEPNVTDKPRAHEH